MHAFRTLVTFIVLLISSQFVLAQENKIYSIRLLGVAENFGQTNRTRVAIEVEYAYSGKPYKEAVLQAWVRNSGKYFTAVKSMGLTAEAGRSKHTIYLFFDPEAAEGTLETNEIAFAFSDADRRDAVPGDDQVLKVMGFRRTWIGRAETSQMSQAPLGVQGAAIPEGEALALARKAINQARDLGCVNVNRILHSAPPDSSGRHAILVVANARCIQMGLENHKFLVLVTRNSSDTQLGGWNAAIFRTDSAGVYEDPTTRAIALLAENSAKRSGKSVPGSTATGPQAIWVSPTTGVSWQVNLGSGKVNAVFGNVPARIDMADPANDSRVHAEGCQVGVRARSSLDDDGSQRLAPKIILDQREMRIANSPLDGCQARNGFETNPLARARATQLLMAQREQDANSKAQSFANRHRVDGGWVNWNSLKANPFALVGKTLMFNTRLEKMNSPNEGVFSGVLFVGVPGSAFTDGRPVVLAGKVLGNAKLKTGPFEILAPRVQYVAHEFCSESECRDMGSIR